LKGAYPRTAFNEESVAVYQLALADVQPRLLQAAVLRHIATNKWFPTIAELRQRVADLILEAEGYLSAPEAWGTVMGEVRRAGHWGQPQLPPLVMRAVHAIGGWQGICLSENGAADRARFLEAYGLLLKQEAQKIQELPAVREARAELAEGSGQVESAVKQVAARLDGDRKR
jgi:hypothetical protein